MDRRGLGWGNAAKDWQLARLTVSDDRGAIVVGQGTCGDRSTDRRGPFVVVPFKFATDDLDRAWGFDPDRHAIARDAIDGQDDVVADDQLFADFAAEHEHVELPLRERPNFLGLGLRTLRTHRPCHDTQAVVVEAKAA